MKGSDLKRRMPAVSNVERIGRADVLAQAARHLLESLDAYDGYESGNELTKALRRLDKAIEVYLDPEPAFPDEDPAAADRLEAEAERDQARAVGAQLLRSAQSMSSHIRYLWSVLREGRTITDDRRHQARELTTAAVDAYGWLSQPDSALSAEERAAAADITAALGLNAWDPE